ncbi:MAG TPA: 3-oxoacyl-ACP synthase III [Pilimelia sp.]|nr:3-oxoacyl-ACP synthase III [Pilimelia sp.]
MLFHEVSIDSVAHIDAPIRLSSAEIVRRLRPTMQRLGMRANLLEDVAGVRERRIWDGPTRVSDAATLAARKALAGSGAPPERIGLLVNTSVCRDYLEPSTASVVHGALGLPDTCQNFDVGNACLAFLSGMDIAARMIERGDIEYALIVDGEVSNEITERTIDRLNSPSTTADQFRQEFASLTLGSGAAAMVLGRRDLVTSGHRYLGGVTRAATAFSHLCRGTMDRMVTDTKTLLDEGLKLAAKTYEAAGAALGWVGADLDEFVLHQVSKVHTDALVDLLGIDATRVLTIFPEHGNIGPASVPVVLSKLNEMGRLRTGARIALMGIGSGLNCTMAEVVW